MTIDKNGKWRMLWGAMPLPAGAEALGTVRRLCGDTGALLRLASGRYVQGNAGAIRTLPQREIAALLHARPEAGGRGGENP